MANGQRVTGVFAAVARQAERTVLQIDLIDVVEQNFSFEFSGMLVHTFHQQRPGQVVRVPWPVFHFGGGGQLTPFSMPVMSTGCRLARAA